MFEFVTFLSLLYFFSSLILVLQKEGVFDEKKNENYLLELKSAELNFPLLIRVSFLPKKYNLQDRMVFWGTKNFL